MGPHELLPACLMFMVSSQFFKFLLSTFNPNSLKRSPYKRGTELSNARSISEIKERNKSRRYTGNALGVILGKTELQLTI